MKYWNEMKERKRGIERDEERRTEIGRKKERYWEIEGRKINIPRVVNMIDKY